MRYHREENKDISYSDARLSHPLYSKSTVFKLDDIGLSVVRLHFNEKTRLFWWDAVDLFLAHEIATHPDFKKYLEKHGDKVDAKGFYPTVNVRKVMWALRMKPLKKEWWEKYVF